MTNNNQINDNRQFIVEEWEFDNYNFTEVPIEVTTAKDLKWPPKSDELKLDSNDPRFHIPKGTSVWIFDHLRDDQFRFRNLTSDRIGYARINDFDNFSDVYWKSHYFNCTDPEKMAMPSSESGERNVDEDDVSPILL